MVVVCWVPGTFFLLFRFQDTKRKTVAFLQLQLQLMVVLCLVPSSDEKKDSRIIEPFVIRHGELVLGLHQHVPSSTG